MPVRSVIGYLKELMFLMSCTPDVETSNDIIYCLWGVKRGQEATKLVNGILLSGFNLSPITYEILIHDLGRTRLVDEAKAHLSNMPNPNIACLVQYLEREREIVNQPINFSQLLGVIRQNTLFGP